MPMATDMQPLLNGPSGMVNHSPSDRHNRHADLPTSSPGRRFGSVLETSQASRSESGPVLIAARAGQARHPDNRSYSTSTLQADRPSSINQRAQEERSVTQTDQKPSGQVEHLDDLQDEKDIETPDQSVQSDSIPSEMMTAAGLIPQASSKAQGETAPPPSVEATHAAHTTVDQGQPTDSMGNRPLKFHPSQSPSRGASAVDRPEASGQLPTNEPGAVETTPAGGLMKASDGAVAGSDTPQSLLRTDPQDQGTAGDVAAAIFDGPLHVEPVKNDSTPVAAVPRMMAQPTAGTDTANQTDLQSPFEAIARVDDPSARPGAPGGEQFFSQDHPPASQSRNGSDHAKPNLLQSDDLSLRAQFQDQPTSVSSSTPPATDGRAGRGEAGQAATVHASERIDGIPGGGPSAQTVTLDLDPLDMGPLRVRIMMTEQIVHTHIRTEHGELGQGLLQHGPSLEASLRTTGFEMGMLRVTVDQQQQGHGETPWTFHQQHSRAELLSGKPAASEDEERVSRAGRDINTSGRVSWFA